MAPHSDTTVLIVDDEERILEAMHLSLIQLPYIYLRTTSPSEAIQILRSRDIAVLLCDLNMPGISGVEILMAAKEVNPDIVSLLITGGGSQEDTMRAINEGGIWRYISKPWNPAELTEIVQEAAELYRCRVAEKTSRQDSTIERPSGKFAKPMIAGKKHIKLKKFSTTERSAAAQAMPSTKAMPKVEKDKTLIGDRYRILSVIGTGGTGDVYLANDEMLDLKVAIKALNKEVGEPGFMESIFKEEARIAMQLSHKHIVRLHNLQKMDGRYYLIMEYVDGCTMSDVIDEDGVYELEDCIPIMRVCADALSYAHRHGVIHKDLKLENLMLSKDGVLKIIDFGIACLANRQLHLGYIMGTPAYMSTEQKKGLEVDIRTDVYSMGIILYELLTGTTPFPADASQDDIMEMDPSPLTGLPVETRVVLEKAIASDRNNRWPTIMDFADAFIRSAMQHS
jgi:CheY-like chemotaxis protein